MIGVGQESGAVAVGEKGFEKEDGGDLIDEVLAVDRLAMGAAGGAGVVAGGVEEGMGFEGGEALVEQVVLHIRVLRAEGFSEGAGFSGLWAEGAVGVERVADYDGGDGVLAKEAGDGLEVGACCGPVDREEGLRCEVELVGEGEADAAIAYVQRENAAGGHG